MRKGNDRLARGLLFVATTVRHLMTCPSSAPLSRVVLQSRTERRHTAQLMRIDQANHIQRYYALNWLWFSLERPALPRPSSCRQSGGGGAGIAGGEVQPPHRGGAKRRAEGEDGGGVAPRRSYFLFRYFHRLPSLY